MRTGARAVRMGEIAVARDDGVLAAIGLGSCIGVALVDAEARLAGLAHVLLPEPASGREGGAGRFATTAVPALQLPPSPRSAPSVFSTCSVTQLSLCSSESQTTSRSGGDRQTTPGPGVSGRGQSKSAGRPTSWRACRPASGGWRETQHEAPILTGSSPKRACCMMRRPAGMSPRGPTSRWSARAG